MQKKLRLAAWETALSVELDALSQFLVKTLT